MTFVSVERKGNSAADTGSKPGTAKEWVETKSAKISAFQMKLFDLDLISLNVSFFFCEWKLDFDCKVILVMMSASLAGTWFSLAYVIIGTPADAVTL